ncbi:MAG: DUF2279 domain-containing protein [Candidatus Cyclobacteriaceae bacterium M2_1C_046]
MKFFKILLLLIFFSGSLLGQDSLRNKRLKPLLLSSAAVYTGTMVALSQTWYDDHSKSSFHFFNDNAEWKQIDKAGHIWSAFHLSSVSYEGLKWSGVNNQSAVLWGSLAGIIMTLPVEWLDGYSAKYGASTGDLISNVTGSALFFAQHKLWDEIRITPKFSFHHTNYATQRPDVLGSSWHDRWLKDYNGQTYWLSFDLDKFVYSESKVLPYINVAVGYGAEDFIYAHDEDNLEAGYNPYRQYYLALDWDLTAIPTKNKWVKRLLFLLNTIHLPAPTVSLGGGELKFHYFYF